MEDEEYQCDECDERYVCVFGGDLTGEGCSNCDGSLRKVLN